MVAKKNFFHSVGMAAYAVGLHSKKLKQCSMILDEVLEAKKQVVEAGTKYILTFKVDNGCDEGKGAICNNLELFQSIACHKADNNKCLKIGNLRCNSSSTPPGKKFF